MDSLQPRFNLLRQMEVYNGYPLSLIIALVIHFLVLAALLYSGITRPPEILDVLQPPSIRAFTIDENPQLRNERVQQQRADSEAQRRRQEEQERQRQEELRRQQEAEEAARMERERQAELEQQRQAELQARDREQQRQRDLAAEQERQRQAELERQRREQQQARERERQQQEQLAAEQQRIREAEEATTAAAEVARTEQELVMAYTGVIHDLIQQNWSRPPSARNGMVVQFRIQMLPTGDVQNVELIRSSGDFAFDRAAETAIYRVGRFQELQGMPINLFNANFRSLLLTFRPEDLLN